MKKHEPEHAVDQIIKHIIAGIFAPLDLIVPELLSGPILFAIAFILISTAITALPSLRGAIAEATFHVSCLSEITKDAGKEYCDFAAIGFQVLIALVIGGIFITDRITETAQGAAQSFQASRQAALDRNQTRLMRDLYRAYVRVKLTGRGIKIWNAPSRFISTISHMQHSLASAGYRIPRFYLFMMVFRFGAAFPKGFYGVIVLFIFEGFLLAQVAKGYFDYLPVCH